MHEADMGSMDVLDRADLPFPESLRSSSGFSRTTSLAPLVWKRRAGRAASPARTAVLLRSRSASPRGPASDVSILPPPDRSSGWRRDGAQPHATQRMVLGGLSGCQPDAGHVGGAVSAAAPATRYETAFGILHKLRAGMSTTRSGPIGGRTGEHVEVDETYVGGQDLWRRAK